jgi:hypothetical protein
MRAFLFTVAFCAVSALAGAAQADGVAIGPQDLSPEVRTALQAQIAEARATQPEAFRAVADVDSYKPEGIRRSRHNKPEAARALRRLGSPALMPMVELLAFDAERGSLTDEQWKALGRGLLQAIGFLRDARGAPALEAVFVKGSEPDFIRDAGEGLGMLCGQRQEKILLAWSKTSGPRQLGAIQGLGFCRTKASAERLATILSDSSIGQETAITTARSLGRVGSSWALAADKSMPADRAETIRRIASQALLDQYTRFGKKVRDQIQDGVLMVEHRPSVGRISSLERQVATPFARELAILRQRLEIAIARAEARRR